MRWSVIGAHHINLFVGAHGWFPVQVNPILSLQNTCTSASVSSAESRGSNIAERLQQQKQNRMHTATILYQERTFFCLFGA